MKFRTFTFLVLIGIILWFVCVDRIETATFCPQCGNVVSQSSIRVAGIWNLNYQEHWDETNRDRLLCDLGISCKHWKTERYLIHRYAGLIIPVPVKKDSIPDVFDLEFYTQTDREKVRGFVQENPALAGEFQKRLMEGEWDANYWYQFNLEIEGERPIRTVTRAHILTEVEKRELVSHLQDIRWIEFSNKQHAWDPNVAVIWAVGEVLAPYLAEKITDTTPSQWLTWATTGDVAYFLLSGMYGGYAVQSKFVELRGTPGEGNPSLNYVDFHRSYLENPDPEVNRKNRLLLQSLWKEHIQEHEKQK